MERLLLLWDEIDDLCSMLWQQASRYVGSRA